MQKHRHPIFNKSSKFNQQCALQTQTATGELASMGWTTLLVVLCYTLYLYCPFAVFPPAPLSIYIYPLATCPVAFLSITLPLYSPSLSLFAAGCVTFYCLTHMTHPFAQTHSQMCAHTQKCWHAHTCTQEQEINRAFWNAKHNSTQQRRTTCCQVSTNKLKFWLAHSAFHWNLKVILFLRCWGTRVFIGVNKSKNELKNCVVSLRLITRGKKRWVMRMSDFSVISLCADVRIKKALDLVNTVAIAVLKCQL